MRIYYAILSLTFGIVLGTIQKQEVEKETKKIKLVYQDEDTYAIKYKDIDNRKN